MAALCRSTLPSEMCRDVLRHLGPQPWQLQKVSSTCEKYVPMLAPLRESKGRLLDDLSAKLAYSGNCSTVDPTTGVKLLTVNPWKPPLPGTNPFTSPVYMLSSAAGATPYKAPMPEQYQPGVAKAKMETPPGSNVVRGVLEANMAHGQRFVVVSDTKRNFQAVISEAARVHGDVVTVDNITDGSSFVNVSFTVKCPSYTTSVTTAHNLLFTPKDTYMAMLKAKVDYNLKFSQVFVKDSYGGAHLKPTDKVVSSPSSKNSQVGTHSAAASMFALQHVMPPLPKSIPPTAVLGTVKLELAEVVSVDSDPAFQKALVAEIASVGRVDASEVVVTSLEIFPEASKSGTVAISGVVEVYFSINMPSEQTAKATAQRFTDCNTDSFGFGLWRRMAELGANRHRIMIQSVGARPASEVAAHPATAEAARLPPFPPSRPAGAGGKDAEKEEDEQAAQTRFGFVSNGYANVLSEELAAKGRRGLEDGEEAAAIVTASDVKRDVLSKVEVPKGGTLAKDRALAAAWATGMTVGAALCAMATVMLAKVWRRRRLYEISPRELPLAGGHWGCMSEVEAPTLAQALE